VENVLEVRGLRKEYDEFTLKDVSFDIPRGYIMGLIGPNGAGKTTIIKLIMNLIRRKAGKIKVFGLDNLGDEVAVKSRIGFVYDVPCYYDDVKLKNIKAAFAPFYEQWNETLFQSLAAEFELPLKKKFKKLSHGMKMKFALALALSHDADLIVMDEPTAGLDPVFRRELLERLSGMMQDERKSVLFSTHITSDLERIADYITFIQDGEIIFSSSKDEVMENWGVVKAGKEILHEESLPFFKGYRESEYGVEALTADMAEAKRRFEPGAVIEKATLEDIMFFMDQGGQHA
jgi:ABC-2 type transport system ATP-binding protein